VTTALAAKDAGQAQSLLDILDEERGRFLHVIAAVPAGELFSVNRVRTALDERGVPDKARAGLFKQAIAAHLIVPVFTSTPMGRDQQVTEPSTGETAHAAHVRVYARTETQLR
jgi:hypothetical protein